MIAPLWRIWRSCCAGIESSISLALECKLVKFNEDGKVKGLFLVDIPKPDDGLSHSFVTD